MYGMQFVNPFKLVSIDGAIQPSTFISSYTKYDEMYIDEDIHTVCAYSLGFIFH